jgi:hypothetical protein
MHWEAYWLIKATITRAAATTTTKTTGRSTYNTAVLDRVCEAAFQIVFYTWQKDIFITRQEWSMLFQEILATDEK